MIIQWRSIRTFRKTISAQTELATLFKLPKTKLKFWHPKSLIKKDPQKSSVLYLSFESDFSFRCFLEKENECGIKEVVEEIIMDADEFENYFK